MGNVLPVWFKSVKSQAVPEDEDTARFYETPALNKVFPLYLPFIMRGWKLNIYKEMLPIVETLMAVTQECYRRRKFYVVLNPKSESSSKFIVKVHLFYSGIVGRCTHFH